MSDSLYVCRVCPVSRREHFRPRSRTRSRWTYPLRRAVGRRLPSARSTRRRAARPIPSPRSTRDFLRRARNVSPHPFASSRAAFIPRAAGGGHPPTSRPIAPHDRPSEPAPLRIYLPRARPTPAPRHRRPLSLPRRVGARRPSARRPSTPSPAETFPPPSSPSTIVALRPDDPDWRARPSASASWTAPHPRHLPIRPTRRPGRETSTPRRARTTTPSASPTPPTSRACGADARRPSARKRGRGRLDRRVERLRRRPGDGVARGASPGSVHTQRARERVGGRIGGFFGVRGTPYLGRRREFPGEQADQHLRQQPTPPDGYAFAGRPNARSRWRSWEIPAAREESKGESDARRGTRTRGGARRVVLG